jgi:hypothetical protein
VRPDEFVKKIAQTVAQTVFVEMYTQLILWKTVAQDFCAIKKNCPKKAIVQWSKIRPIWSPCRKVKPSLGCANASTTEALPTPGK